MASKNEETIVREGFWPKIGKVFARVPFSRNLAATWYCAFDPATPLKTRGILLAALAYFIMPLDVVPDMLLGLGFTDDLAVLMVAMRSVWGSVKPVHYQQADAALERMRNSDTIINHK